MDGSKQHPPHPGRSARFPHGAGILIALGAALILFVCMVVAARSAPRREATPLTVPHTVRSASDNPLSPSELVYLGAFRVPTAPGDPDPTSLSSGGVTLTYSAVDDGAPDGFSGSLWISSRASASSGNLLGRISIPAPSLDPDPNNWNVATILDAVADFPGPHWGAGQRPELGASVLLPSVDGAPGALIFGATWDYYLGNDVEDKNHFFFAAPGAFASRSALMHIGEFVTNKSGDDSDPTLSLKTSGYAWAMPGWWGDMHRVAGDQGPMYLAAGNGKRESGHNFNDGTFQVLPGYNDDGRQGCHLGPGWGVVCPESLYANGATTGYEADYLECAGYRSGKPAQADFPYVFNDKDSWTAGAFISTIPNVLTASPRPAAWATECAIVFLVEDSEGDEGSDCYHHPPESTCSDCCGGTPGTGYVSGNPDGGPHCTSPELWFYDLAAFEFVLSGQAAFHSPRAYDKIDLGQYFYTYDRQCEFFNGTDHVGITCGGMTFNDAARYLFLVEGGILGCCNRPPFIHVFRVGPA